MHTTLTQDFVRKLPLKDEDYNDKKTPGLFVRGRATGNHSYMYRLRRGKILTLGLVSKFADRGGVEAIRAHIDTIKAAVAKPIIDALAEGATLAQAQAKGIATHLHQQAQREAEVDVLTLRQFLADTYEPMIKATQPEWKETMQTIRNRFAEFLDLPLDAITPTMLDVWKLGRLAEGKASDTVRRNLMALSGAFTVAMKRKLITTHPVREDGLVPRASDPLDHNRYLDADEARRLEQALAKRDAERRAARKRGNTHKRVRGYDERPEYGVYTDHMTPLVLLALNTGMRRGELFKLRWKDVHLTPNPSQRRIEIRAKTAKTGEMRSICLNERAYEVLKAWRPADVSEEALVFPGKDGQPLVDIKTAWKAIREAAGVTRFRFHDTRHDFASRLVQEEVDLYRVSDLLGHASTKMTQRYARLNQSHQADAVARLSRRRKSKSVSA